MSTIHAIISELPGYGKAVLVVIELLFGLLAVGFIVGLITGVLEVFGNAPVRFIVSSIRKVLWAIPPIVLLSLVFYLPFDLSPMVVGIIGLGLCSGAFQSQIFRGAILAVKPEQMLAARAMGLGRFGAIRFVVMPQAIRFAIGPWTNEFSSEVKATSYAYVVGVIELMRQTKYIIAYTYGHSAALYFFVAVIYFILTRTGNFFFYRLADKLWVPGFEKRKE